MPHSFSKRISETTPFYNFIRQFAFPSTQEIAVSSPLIAGIGVGMAFLIVQQTPASFYTGVMWGVTVLTLPSFVSTFMLSRTVMSDDPLFYLRRCLAFSLFTDILWVIVFLLTSILSLMNHADIFPDIAVILGLFVVMPLRAITVFAMSRINFVKRIIFVLTEPTLTALLLLLFFEMPLAKVVTVLTLSTMMGLTFAFILIISVEKYGRRVIGFSPIRMFRAFLIDWLEGKNGELESYLNELGVQTEIDVAAFVFRRKSTKQIKGIVLVSNFHPGPFLNIGSSVLPFLFQRVVCKRLNAVGLVPHGVSGHELNLVSQEQNVRVIQSVLTNLAGLQYSSLATPVTRARNEIATATSQVFDECALVTMTTSPSDMEDVPSDVLNRITGLTRGAFRHVALIDAHNCLTGPTTMTSEKVGGLEDAALASLQYSAGQDRDEFWVGACSRRPSRFTIKDGFGPGGIVVIAVEVKRKRFAYVNLDGNNMAKGLRELIIERARKVGFDDCEVLTTDTHMVNGIVSAKLGYHPIGEAVPEESLLDEVESVCQTAVNDLEPCEAGVIMQQIPVTTLGSKSLKRVMNLVYKISRITAVAVFVVVVVVASISFLLLV